MITYHLKLDRSEEKPITLKVLDLQEGETVVSANLTHTPPSGDPLQLVASVDSPYVNMLFGPFAVVGQHYVVVQAVGSGSSPSKPVALYLIHVF